MGPFAKQELELTLAIILPPPPLFTYDVDCILSGKGGQAQDDDNDGKDEEEGEDMANGKLHLAAAVSDSQCHHSTVHALCVLFAPELPSQFSGSMFS